MRKPIMVVLALGVVIAGLTPGQAANKKKVKKVTRVVESVYDAPAIGSGAGICPGATNSCGRLAAGSKEKFVTIEITDATGLPVYATVSQDLDGDSFSDESTTICGTSTEPISIHPGVEVIVFPWAVGRPSCPGLATTGVVKATFANLP